MRNLDEQPPALGGSEQAEALDRVIRRALAKNPKERYESAAQMAEVLASVTLSEDTGMPDVQTVTRLVVLPFRMLRPSPDVDFLAESLPDAITHALAGLQSLVVRSTAVASKLAGDGRDLGRIAREADVDVALTGSILHSGDRMQVQVQLLQVPSGTVLWSQRPQVSVRDVFQLQEQIVDKIVDSLSLSLTARERRMLASDVPVSPTAYEYFLRGNRLVYPQGMASIDNLMIAQELYQQAVEEDPGYAPPRGSGSDAAIGSSAKATRTASPISRRPSHASRKRSSSTRSFRSRMQSMPGLTSIGAAPSTR